MGQRPKRPDAVKLGLSDDVWNLVEECWRKEPALRPSTSFVLQCLVDAEDKFSRRYLVDLDPTSKDTVEELRRVLIYEYPTLFQLQGADARSFIEFLDQVSPRS
jgi:hypothetical protein